MFQSFGVIAVSCVASLWAVPTIAQEPLDLRFNAGIGPGLSLPDALEDLVLTFIGPSPDTTFFRRSTGPVFGEIGNIPVSNSRSLAVSFEVSQVLARRSDWTLSWDLTGALGNSSFTLPQGVGPFSDPAQIKMRYAAVTPRVFGQLPPFSTHYGTWGARFGAGSEIILVDTNVTSDLLDIDHQGWYHTNFVFSDLSLRFGPNERNDITAGIQVGDNETLALMLTSGISF